MIESGEAEVVGDGRVVATLGPGEGFGEIALLRRTRRTATVRASSELRLQALRSDHFLPVVLGYTPSAREAGRWSTRCSTASRPGSRRNRRPAERLEGPRTGLAPCDMTSGRSLLLIADIGGYTEYMSTHRMSLAHAEVNTARLLEKVIDAAPGFELIEIEGDAAFLSRPADARDRDEAVAEVVRAAAAMHRAFHLERQYVATNLCPCNGCTQADNLKLKFVAHVGEVATQTIRQRRKLVGIDVILVHRLLKNPVAVPEYVLLSEDLYRHRRRPAARPRARGVPGPRGDRPGPRVLRRRRRPRRPVAAAAGAVLVCSASGGRWPSPAPACRTCWACAAGGARRPADGADDRGQRRRARTTLSSSDPW